MNAIQLLTTKLYKMTINEACWLGRVYRCDNEELLCEDSQGKPERVALVDLSERPWDMIQFARNIDAGFWGGPPKNENFYCGTILTFLVDNILRKQVHDNIGFAWLLTFDGSSSRSMKEQLEHYMPNSLTQKLFWEANHEEISCPFDNPIVDYVQIGNKIYPIHEDGSQGQSCGEQIYPSGTSAPCDSCDCGTVYPHTASGVRVRVRV